MRPRIRNLKPELWNSADVVALSVLGKVAWVALISLADDEGRLKTDVRHLDMVAIRSGELSELQGQLDLMESRGMIRQWGDGAGSYVAILNWAEHQRVDKPARSTLPAPPASADDEGTASREFANRRESSRIVANAPAPCARGGPDRTGPRPSASEDAVSADSVQGFSPIATPDSAHAQAREQSAPANRARRGGGGSGSGVNTTGERLGSQVPEFVRRVASKHEQLAGRPPSAADIERMAAQPHRWPRVSPDLAEQRMAEVAEKFQRRNQRPPRDLRYYEGAFDTLNEQQADAGVPAPRQRGSGMTRLGDLIQ
jgi:hypothetical protein